MRGLRAQVLLLLPACTQCCEPWCETAPCSELTGSVEQECGDCPSTHRCCRTAHDFVADEPVLNFELGERLTPHSKESDDEYEAFYGGAHAPDQIDGATETLWAQLTIAQQQGACPDQVKLTETEQSNGFPALVHQAFRGLDSCEPMPLRRLLCSLAKLPSAPAAAILREAIEARAEMSACIGLVLASADLEIGRNLATANYEELVGLISHREWDTRLAGGEVFAALIPAPWRPRGTRRACRASHAFMQTCQPKRVPVRCDKAAVRNISRQDGAIPMFASAGAKKRHTAARRYIT